MWLNAINAARVSMSSGTHQKDAVIKLLEKYADDMVDGNNSSDTFNVVLAATLFHPLYDSMNACNVGQKYTKVINEKLFKKVFIMAIQKETFEKIYDFLESEAKNEA